ncbi:MAG: efflux RND transporter periplasmic adaptor subunit [Legionellaceae bacterium]
MKNNKLNLRQLSFLIVLLIMGCDNPKKHASHSTKTYTLKTTTLSKTLYFTGTVQPLRESTITSPVDAVIDAAHYHYGQTVAKDAVVFTLNSMDLQNLYNETLTDYLKAEDRYTIARAKFIGTEDLWQSGLLSKNNYLSEKSSLNTERVTLMQATKKVVALLEKMGHGNRADEELAGLSLSEFDKVSLALMNKHNLIELKAPRKGVLLYPPKSNEEKNAHLSVGSSIKAGQVLALIGDMRGIRIDIDIPEVDIDKIKQGLPATIRGVAFGKQALHGELVAINAQASTKNGAGLPSFTAVVEVKPLNDALLERIKVGMSASIELFVQSENKLLVPIAALSDIHGQTKVSLKQPDGTTRLTQVITGTVQGNQVVIEEGLSSGDVIIYEE